MSQIVLIVIVIPLMSITGLGARAHQQEQAPAPVILRNSNSGRILQPIALKKVKPVYPGPARAARISGFVTVEVAIDESGNVINALALLGHPLLKDAAVQAALEWKFIPAMLSDIPAKLIAHLTFSFGLDTIPELENEVSHHLESAKAHNKLAAAYYASARYSDAAHEAAAAINIDPDVAGARLKLGESLTKLQRNQEAIVYLEKAARLAPSDPEAQFALGVAFTGLGRYEDALGLYRGVLNSTPAAFDVYFYLGDTYSAMGRHEAAIDSFKQGIKLKPERLDGYTALGQVYLKLGRTDEAIACFKHAVTNHSFDADVRDAVLGLGLAYARAGDKKSALETYSILQQLDPAMASQLLSEIEK
jgi:TonB family protein